MPNFVEYAFLEEKFVGLGGQLFSNFLRDSNARYLEIRKSRKNQDMSFEYQSITSKNEYIRALSKEINDNDLTLNIEVVIKGIDARRETLMDCAKGTKEIPDDQYKEQWDLLLYVVYTLNATAGALMSK